MRHVYTQRMLSETTLHKNIHILMRPGTCGQIELAAGDKKDPLQGRKLKVGEEKLCDKCGQIIPLCKVLAC